MNFKEAVARLDENQIPYIVHEHEATLTMDDVASRQVFDMDHSLKALAFDVGGETLLAVLVGNTKINFGNLARACDVKRKAIRALSPEEVTARLGDLPGGVGPIQDESVRVVIDDSISLLDTVFCGAGSPERTFEIQMDALLKVIKYEFAEIARPASVSA